MPDRYATIIAGDDGQEVVSAIGLFEGAAPQARAGRIEPVVAGVLIGMVRGGPVDAIGGFGFAGHGVDGRAIALVEASLQAAPPARLAAAAADAAGAAADGNAARKPARPKAARRKPRKVKSRQVKSRKNKSGKIERAASPAAKPAGISDHG
jgi:hypothetical protein